ncbi:hypothetical protein AK830_g7151 [Neonectria ditissima]|uniref:F-box domain-containing protein n=1 Tax=Neonectria ditissima TaxID=78410 RepID=A0A0N8H6M6_9HYPO|nr:hypothetical protein AK830_g7151 [Neonectria ditissima]
MSRKTIAPSRAEKLPPELLEIVFSFLDPEDFVAPGPRSQSLWTQAITWAQNGYRRWRAEYSWAGTPIICTGTHLSSLPQPMYDMFPEATPSPPPQGLISRQRISRANRNEASEWNHNVTNSYNKNPIPYDESYRENFGKIVSLAGIPERLHEAMAACLPTLDIEHGSKWYLRNLTQKEYIRMEIAKTTTGEITVVLLGKNWLTLDILLMWLISWSQKDYETGFTWEELEQGDVYNDIQDADLMDTNRRERRIGQVFKSMKAGKWAAHALDVVDVEMGEGWFDRHH